MSDSRLRVIVIFGGQSGEHEVSLNSANSVLQAIDRQKYSIETIGISKQGQWIWGILPDELLTYNPNKDYPLVTLVHDPTNPRFLALDSTTLPDDGCFDLIFPVLHGTYGEDGTIQGLFEIANVPYVGSGVLGSSLGMDKDRMKAAFLQAGLKLGTYLSLLRSRYKESPDRYIKQIEEQIGYPCFVKPANLGSSVGISKAHDRQELIEALDIAGIFDRKIIIEQNIPGREIEVSVLGNDNPQASLPGEILPAKEFYDYEAKYENASSRLIIPAELDEELISKLKEKAVSAFLAVEACGLARVDFFLTPDKEIIINEINTMPGFTKISMYPKLWDVSGIPYSTLIDRLIDYGIERFNEKKERRLSKE